MPPPRAVLYSRGGCHLCDVAREQLERHGLAVEVVDIDPDPELVARYTNDVPVVVIDGVERFRGRIDERFCADCYNKAHARQGRAASE